MDRSRPNEFDRTRLDRSLRVENWDDSVATPYRVRHGRKASYEGVIRKNPIDKREFVAVGFTGNSINPGHGGDISKDDLVENIKRIQPDLLFSFREIRSLRSQTPLRRMATLWARFR